MVIFAETYEQYFYVKCRQCKIQAPLNMRDLF